MQVSLWKPMDDLRRVSQEMNKVFSRFLDPAILADPEETLEEQIWAPRVNIREDKDNYYVSLDLPGMKKDDVKITLKNDMLQIEGERKSEKEEKGKNWLRQESVYGKFFRSFRLPEDVDTGKTEAKFEDGVLNIQISKREDAKPKEISINIK